MSLCNQKYIDPSTGKESTDTKNKCCIKASAGDEQPKVFCDNTELTESICTETGVTKFIKEMLKNQGAPKQYIESVKIDEISWCGSNNKCKETLKKQDTPKKLSTLLIVVIAVSGVSLLALIIFLIKKSQAKMRIY